MTHLLRKGREGRSPVRSALAASALAVAISVLPTAANSQGQAGFTIRENGRSYAALQDAVNAIGEGRGTIVIAPGTYQQCAVQEAGDITYTAWRAGTVTFDGATCEDKAALVLRGRNARVDGLIFRRMNVPDSNGAGIRLETGNLQVSQSWFTDSQQGILTGDNPAGTIDIDKSTFTRLGNCENAEGCAHSIYIGNYGTLRVTRSRFERGVGGHYVKSRSTRVDINSSSFDDANGRGTNYMIDLPASSTGRITNNWFVQGQDKENYSAFIAVGAEERLHTANGLTVAGNEARFAPGVRRESTFVADWTGDRIAIQDNELASGLKQFDRR